MLSRQAAAATEQTGLKAADSLEAASGVAAKLKVAADEGKVVMPDLYCN